MKMRYNAVIFDLDGTLTDTLQDLWLSTNHALHTMGWPQRSIDEVRRFVGNGVRRLMEQAVPAGTGEEDFEQCFRHFREYYVQHCQDNTDLYPGVRDMMLALQRQGVKMAIVSNKLQAGVDELRQRFFGGLVDVAIGEQPPIPRKPAPDMVHAAMSQLGVQPHECVYVGDSEVDLATARNSGLPCISVLWGFRDRETLLQHGATVLINQPNELICNL